MSTSTYRCPVSACAGWVSLVADDEEEGPFWGCGECGSIWRERVNLLAEIDAMVARFPYRAGCYRRADGGWLPADPASIPAEYERRVQEEPADEAEDYARG